MTHISRLVLKNFRCFPLLDLELGAAQVLFGPNGSGKSTVLRALRLLSACVKDTPAVAARFEGPFSSDFKPPDEPTSVAAWFEQGWYQVDFLASARSREPQTAERFVGNGGTPLYVGRALGADSVSMRLSPAEGSPVATTETQRNNQSALSQYAGHPDSDPVVREAHAQLTQLVHIHCRHMRFDLLLGQGSPVDALGVVDEHATNLWTCLRNVHDSRDLDERFKTIEAFFRKAFPDIRALAVSQYGPKQLSAVFKLASRRSEVFPHEVGDGVLSFLAVMAALFSQPKGMSSTILLDEPDLSLHPWAIAVLGEAIRKASSPEWGRQVIVATHSPTLLGQFEREQCFAFERGESNQPIVNRVDRISDISQLLNEYSLGTLYMAEAVSPQGLPGEVIER